MSFIHQSTASIKKEKVKLVNMKIKTMADIIGISVGGLRKYEEYNIVNPHRNESTDQREYDGMDMGHLINARRYRQLHYSLADTAHLLNESDLKTIQNRHLKMVDSLDKEVQYALRSRERLMEVVNFIEEVDFGIQTFSIRRRPAMWLIPLIENNRVIEDEVISEFRKQCISCIPSACVTLIYPFSPNQPHIDGFRYAISIFKEDALLWEMERIHQVEVVEEETCLYTCCKQTDHNEQIAYYLEKALQYLNNNGLSLNGNILTRGVLFTNKGSSVYREIWIPVKKKS